MVRPPPRPGSPHWGGYSRDPHPPLSRPAGPRRLAAPRRDLPVAPRVSASPRWGGVGPRNEAARVGRSGRAVGPQEGGGRAHGVGGGRRRCRATAHLARRRKKKKRAPTRPEDRGGVPRLREVGGGKRVGWWWWCGGTVRPSESPVARWPGTGPAADDDLLPAGAGRGPPAPQPGDTEKATRWAEAVAFVASAFPVATEWRSTCRRPWPRLSVVYSQGPYRKEFTSWSVENYPQLDGTGTGECSRRWACRAGQHPPPGQPHEDGLGGRWSPREREDGLSMARLWRKLGRGRAMMGRLAQRTLPGLGAGGGHRTPARVHEGAPLAGRGLSDSPDRGTVAMARRPSTADGRACEIQLWRAAWEGPDGHPPHPCGRRGCCRGRRCPRVGLFASTGGDACGWGTLLTAADGPSERQRPRHTPCMADVHLHIELGEAVVARAHTKAAGEGANPTPSEAGVSAANIGGETSTLPRGWPRPHRVGYLLGLAAIA